MKPEDLTHEERQSAHFLSLLLSLNQSALICLGKTASPLTGESSLNLEEARNTIDLLAMLKEKTQGNLDGREEKLLDEMLAQLRILYVEAVKENPAPGED